MMLTTWVVEAEAVLNRFRLLRAADTLTPLTFVPTGTEIVTPS